MAQFKPKSSSIKAPTIGGGKDSGIGTLLAYMVSQQKNQQAQQALPPDAIPTGGTINGINYKVPGKDKQEQKELRSSKFQSKNFENLKGSLQAIPQGRVKGGISLLKAHITGGRGQEGSNSLFYAQNRPATAVALYRDLTGDTRTSDADAASRALPLIPSQTEHPDLIKKKIASIENAFKLKQQLIETGDFTPDENGNPVTPQTLQAALQGVSSPDNSQNQEDGGGDEEAIFNAWKQGN